MNNNIFKYDTILSKSDRENLLNQRSKLIWFTGLSGSGKSTIADNLCSMLSKLNYKTYLLDGDNIRQGINSDLGFKDIDREENIRRVSEIAKILLDAGLIVCASFISPFLKDRENAKKLVGKNNFIEIYLNTPLKVCISRDPKGLYKKSIKGEIKDFTGIESDYEPPRNPDIVIDTSKTSINDACEEVLNYIKPKIKK